MLFITLDPLDIRTILLISLIFLLHSLSFILAGVLFFCFDITNRLRSMSDEHRLMFYHLCFNLPALASYVIAAIISCIMISRYGPSIEKLITYVMGDNNMEEEEEEYYTWPIRSPNYGMYLDVPLPVPTGDRPLAVNNKRIVIIRCAYTVIQIFVYLIGYLASLEFGGKGDRIIAGMAVSSLSMFFACTFKLFSASHQYSSIMAKWIIANACVFEVVFLALGTRDWSSFAHPCLLEICFGLIAILIGIYVMRNPVDKLYTIYYIKKKSYGLMEV